MRQGVLTPCSPNAPLRRCNIWSIRRYFEEGGAVRKLVPVLLVMATGALAAAGRVAVWLDVHGSSDYLLVEAARAGFGGGLTGAGWTVAPRDEVPSINTVINPAVDAQLAQLAAALGCDYAAALTVTAAGGGVEISGLVFDPFAWRRYESLVALAESADGARTMAARLAGELAKGLPAAGPVLSLAARWSTVHAALGAADG